MRPLSRYIIQMIRNRFRWRCPIYQPHLLVCNNPVHYAQNLSRNYGNSPGPVSTVFNDNLLYQIDIKLQKGNPIPKKLVERLIIELQNFGKIYNFDAFLVIKSCGKSLMDADAKESIELVHYLWDTLESLEVKLEVSHYNALLDVYLEKDYDFSPNKFLSTMIEKSVEPNRVTFQRLIAACCKKGDIAEVMALMVEMKSRNLPLTEENFNMLILGHSQAGDIDSAINTLAIMKDKGIVPSIDTETALMCAYAKQGDFKSLNDSFEKLAANNFDLEERHYMEIFQSLVINGHLEQAENFLSKMPKDLNSDIDTSRLIIKLIKMQHTDLALRLLKSTTANSLRLHARINIFLGSLVKTDTKVEEVIQICERIKKDFANEDPFKEAVYFYLFNGISPSSTLEMMKAWRKVGGQIHDHFFWPLLVLESKASNVDGILNVLKSMIEDFKITPSLRTLRDFTIPYMFGSRKEIINRLKPLNISADTIVIAMADRCIIERQLKNAAILMTFHETKFPTDDEFLHRFVETLNARNDVKSFVVILRLLYSDSGKVSAVCMDKILRKVIDVVPDYRPSVMISLLQELTVAGLSISEEIAGEIRSYLANNVEEVDDVIKKLESGELTEVPMSEYNPYLLQRSEGSGEIIPHSQVYELRNQFNKYVTEFDNERAAAVCKQLDAIGYVTPPFYAMAIGVFCDLGDLETAGKYVEQFSEKLPQHNLSFGKGLKFAELLVKNNRFEEAVRFIKRQPVAKDKQAFSRTNVKAVESLLALTANQESLEKTFQMIDLLADKKLLKAATFPLGIIIESFLEKKEHTKALEVFERAVTEYMCTPNKIKLLETLLLRDDQVNLKRFLEFNNDTWGEKNTDFSMALVNLSIGKYQLVRKYFKNLGSFVSNFQIGFFIDYLEKTENFEALEEFIEITKRLDGNHTNLFKRALKVYVKYDDWEGAMDLWMKMQEDEINPDREFLVTLKKLLVRHQQKVPFVCEDSYKSDREVSGLVG
ncbi:GSCOCG00003964001-RA-CDS [Cotesia congregata]|uniref:Mitochondrial (Xenopus tropicalis) n=1 Tax=Cotesia congregata TaxID=51543 RepID=A0A8J2H7E2_COTCN|nr:GSCOCG00003964001-RA-CDS [Cotesia congregata]CAG5081706.1 Similar to lrpprc: Leucine-rich PPR motif-containing protein [Cotesia congregata]